MTETKHGRAAFAREDVDDAARGRPDVDLTSYAEQRGLAWLGSTPLGAFRGLLPAWPDYVFNAMHGVLPGGRFGLLEHELEEIPVTDDSIDMNGGFHNVRYVARGSTLLGLAIPLFDQRRKERNAPFAASAVWVPTTKVVVRVPEATLLPRIAVRSKERFPPLGNPKLDDVGLPGYRLAGGKAVDAELRRALFAGAAAQALAQMHHPYVALTIADGAVALQCNGFVREPAELDRLAEAACAIADGAREASRPQWAEQPFEQDLPAPPELGLRETLGDRFRPLPHHADAFVRAAGELGLAQEDPLAYHRAFPHLPIPGTAKGVLCGRLPGTDVRARLAWHMQSGVASGSLRGAALLKARPGAHTDPGGVLVTETDMYAAVAGDVVACWMRTRAADRLDSRPLIERALATVRHLGLAET